MNKKWVQINAHLRILFSLTVVYLWAYNVIEHNSLSWRKGAKFCEPMDIVGLAERLLTKSSYSYSIHTDEAILGVLRGGHVLPKERARHRFGKLAYTVLLSYRVPENLPQRVINVAKSH